MSDAPTLDDLIIRDPIELAEIQADAEKWQAKIDADKGQKIANLRRLFKTLPCRTCNGKGSAVGASGFRIRCRMCKGTGREGTVPIPRRLLNELADGLAHVLVCSDNASCEHCAKAKETLALVRSAII